MDLFTAGRHRSTGELPARRALHKVPRLYHCCLSSFGRQVEAVVPTFNLTSVLSLSFSEAPGAYRESQRAVVDMECHILSGTIEEGSGRICVLLLDDDTIYLRIVRKKLRVRQPPGFAPCVTVAILYS